MRVEAPPQSPATRADVFSSPVTPRAPSPFATKHSPRKHLPKGQLPPPPPLPLPPPPPLSHPPPAREQIQLPPPHPLREQLQLAFPFYLFYNPCKEIDDGRRRAYKVWKT
ncbi:hypothetical protein MKW92_028670 [Papaver armeniacum]|nr:hypothetical protein MKW92_028670 [Papaver armeniacum]